MVDAEAAALADRSDVTNTAPGARPYVDVAGVSKTYRRAGRETHALESIDLAIRNGEFLAIVGPSGCGKSTLLRIVAGLVGASRGEVRVEGARVDRPQTNLGIVFQSPVLLDWRTALDNVLVQIELRSLDPRAYRDNALRLLDQIGLDREALWLATHKTVMFITHSIEEAVLLADRVVVMSPRPGRIERTIDIP